MNKIGSYVLLLTDLEVEEAVSTRWIVTAISPDFHIGIGIVEHAP